MYIFDHFSGYEIKNYFLKPVSEWPDLLKNIILDCISRELLNNWVEQASKEEYEERMHNIMKDYGYLDV